MLRTADYVMVGIVCAAYYKTFEYSISYRADLKNKSFQIGHFSVTLMLKVLHMVL
jgi:hypothetical protein